MVKCNSIIERIQQVNFYSIESAWNILLEISEEIIPPLLLFHILGLEQIRNLTVESVNNRKQLLNRINWDAQDIGMIRLRNEDIGNKLQIRCTELWKELLNAVKPTDDLINRLTIFHNDVELSAKQTGLYDE